MQKVTIVHRQKIRNTRTRKHQQHQTCNSETWKQRSARRIAQACTKNMTKGGGKATSLAGSQGPEAGGRGPRGWGAGYRGPRGREAAPGGRGPGARNRGRQNCSHPRFFDGFLLNDYKSRTQRHSTAIQRPLNVCNLQVNGEPRRPKLLPSQVFRSISTQPL